MKAFLDVFLFCLSSKLTHIASLPSLASGFAHSGVPQRSLDDTGHIYEDESGYMGWLNYGTTSPQKCFNGPKLYQAKWFVDRHATWSIESSSKEYSLIGSVDYQNANEDEVIVLKLDTPLTSPNNDIDYYVMFNRQFGANSGTVYGDKVLVTTSGENGNSYSQSTLLAKLDEEDSSYTIINFGDTGIDVTILVNTIDLSSTPAVASICITTTGDCASTSVSTTQPPPSTTTLPPDIMTDLFLLGGQSNMQGHSTSRRSLTKNATYFLDIKQVLEDGGDLAVMESKLLNIIESGRNRASESDVRANLAKETMNLYNKGLLSELDTPLSFGR